MLMHTRESVTFFNEKVQRQANDKDCGLFALAFSTDVCHGIDPATQSYDQVKLREHYVSCLDSRNMVPFPRTTRRVPYHLTTRNTTVPIFRVCRMPNDKKEYVQCSQCCGWYHPTCVNIPMYAISTNRKWRCDKCRASHARKPNLHLVN